MRALPGREHPVAAALPAITKVRPGALKEELVCQRKFTRISVREEKHTGSHPQDGIYEGGFFRQGRGRTKFRTAVKYWVYGSDVSPWEYHDGLKVKIIPDKQLYKPGETARLLIQTPIEGGDGDGGAGKGAPEFCRKLTLDNPVIEVPLEEADAPNVYISVFLVKGGGPEQPQGPQSPVEAGICRAEGSACPAYPECKRCFPPPGCPGPVPPPWSAAW